MTASYIRGVALDLAAMLKGKNQDYAPGDEFSNFTNAAMFAGVTPEEVMKAQLGIKWTRLDSLFDSGVVVNESIEDNLMDLAGYAIILAAYLRWRQANEPDDEEEYDEGYM